MSAAQTKMNTRVDYLEDKIEMLEQKMAMFDEKLSMIKENMQMMRQLVETVVAIHKPHHALPHPRKHGVHAVHAVHAVHGAHAAPLDEEGSSSSDDGAEEAVPRKQQIKPLRPRCVV